MTPAAYSDAMFPEGRTVFGVPLLPLCIGHALLLHRLRSPLIGAPSIARQPAPEAEQCSALPGLGDLLLAVEICRRPGAQLPSRARMKWLGLQQLRFTELQKLRLEGRHLDGIRDFREYWNAAHGTFPEIIRNPQARDTGVPLLASLQIVLMGRLGFTPADALRTPVSAALWLVAGDSALRGDLKLKTDEDASVFDAHAQLQRRLAAGEKIEDLMAEARAKARSGAPDSDPAAAANAGSETGAPAALSLAAASASLRSVVSGLKSGGPHG
jgi:hypothetical protein